MPIQFTEDQLAFQDMARRFAQREVEPVANSIDSEEHTPEALTAKAAEVGLFGLYIPSEYGGSGADVVSACLVSEEIAKASPAFAGALTVQMILCPKTVEILGSDEQKQRILSASASGERVIAYSQSEPAGAANVMAHLTRLEPHEDGSWRLNGAKLFCTQASAQTYLVMCKTRDHDGREGYGCIIVEREAPGFRVEPYERKLGWRGTNTGPLSFDDVRIERKDILGDILNGGVAHRAANQANVLAHAATSLGCAQGLFDKTLDYVKQRRLYGRDMSELQPVGYWLAEAYAKLQACRALLYTSAAAFDRGEMPVLANNVSKAWIGDTAFDICARLLQLWGGSGIMDSTGVNRYMRDAKAKCIAEGSSEIHYAIIANQLFHDRPTLVPPSLG